MEDVHQPERNQMGETRKHSRCCWNMDGNVNREGERWMIVPTYIWWSVWTERNMRCFEYVQISLQNLYIQVLNLSAVFCMLRL